MKNKRIINIDIEKYMIFIYKPTDRLIAIDISKSQSLIDLKSRYGDYSNIPNDEVIEGILLTYNAKKNIYKIQSNRLFNYTINKLDPSIQFFLINSNL